MEEELIDLLKKGRVAVMPTDTIYGLVGSALNPDTVSRVYKIKNRNKEKPCIILIGSTGELKRFGINLSEKQNKVLEQYWLSSRPTSIILPCPSGDFSYLDCGSGSMAFRLPALENLRSFLLQTGPLVAPSANPENMPPAGNIEEAKKYFGDSVDFYMDGPVLKNKPSRLVRLDEDGSVSIIRE